MCYHYRNTLDSKDLVQEKKGFKTANQFFLKIFYVDHFKSIRFITISLMFHVLVFWLWGPAPWPGIKPTPPELKGKVSSTGPPGKPLINILKSETCWNDTLDVCVLSYVWLYGTRWTAAVQAPLFMGSSRQEFWNGLSFPTPGDLPNPGIKTESPALASGFFTTVSPIICICRVK